jgi:type II secretory pathway predicted ATPase ExeA/septal ring-binding cell division protein DamX
VALYLEHFGLAEAPFRITPHPDFFFDGADRGATLEALLYAILHDEGIVKVSGEIGSGKTMLCRVLIERLPPEVQTVFLANPMYSRAEILEAIADELGVRPAPGASAISIRDLQSHLIAQYAEGRRVVVLIDEAHAMPRDALEQVRLLTNLETGRAKLLQIVLFGQPELDGALDAAPMRQLKDRITHSFRMRPLTEPEVARYLAHRMRAAGYRGPDVFDQAAIAAIAHASSGLTRRINVLADKALLAAFAAGAHAVSAGHARAAIADSEFAPIVRPRMRRAARVGAAAALLALGAIAGAGLYALVEDTAPAAAISQAPAQVSSPQAPLAVEANAPAPGSPAPIPPAAVAEPGRAPPPREPLPGNAPESEQPTEPLLSPEQLKRMLAYPTGASQVLKERIAATRERLARAPDSHWSLELFVTDNSDAARTERFLLRARDMVPLEDVYVIPVLAGRHYQIRVTFGTYATREEALEAARRLPPKYQRAFQIEPRNFAELRAAV